MVLLSYDAQFIKSYPTKPLPNLSQTLPTVPFPINGFLAHKCFPKRNKKPLALTRGFNFCVNVKLF